MVKMEEILFRRQSLLVRMRVSIKAPKSPEGGLLKSLIN
jgi:hypothetical protein